MFEVLPNSYSRDSQLNQLTYPIPTPNVPLKSNNPYLLPPNTHTTGRNIPLKRPITPPQPKINTSRVLVGRNIRRRCAQAVVDKGPWNYFIALVFFHSPPFHKDTSPLIEVDSRTLGWHGNGVGCCALIGDDTGWGRGGGVEKS